MEKILTLQVTIFLLVAAGFAVKRLGMIGPQGQKNMNDLVIYVILPCNILHAFMSSPVEGRLGYYLEVLLISIGIQVFCVLYGRIAFREEPEGRNKCLRYGTICSNAGFLGNPIAEGIYGAEGLVLASIYLIPQRIMMWTSGLAVFSGTTDRKAAIKKVLDSSLYYYERLGTFADAYRVEASGRAYRSSGCFGKLQYCHVYDGGGDDSGRYRSERFLGYDGG